MRISDWSSDVCSSDLSGDAQKTSAELLYPARRCVDVLPQQRQEAGGTAEGICAVGRLRGGVVHRSAQPQPKRCAFNAKRSVRFAAFLAMHCICIIIIMMMMM